MGDGVSVSFMFNTMVSYVMLENGKMPEQQMVLFYTLRSVKSQSLYMK